MKNTFLLNTMIWRADIMDETDLSCILRQAQAMAFIISFWFIVPIGESWFTSTWCTRQYHCSSTPYQYHTMLSACLTMFLKTFVLWASLQLFPSDLVFSLLLSCHTYLLRWDRWKLLLLLKAAWPNDQECLALNPILTDS